MKTEKNPFRNLIGNWYRNLMTGNEWKVVKVVGRRITLESIEGNRFDTIPEGMGNYVWIVKPIRKRMKV